MLVVAYDRFVRATVSLAAFLLATVSGLASVQKDFFQNADLSNGNNYSPSGLPSSSVSDVLLTTTSTALTLNGASLSMSSLNQLNNLAYVISGGGMISLSPINGNVVGANPNDAIYLGGSNSSLTLESTVSLQVLGNGNFHVAQAGSTLSIAGEINNNTAGTVTKTGAGTLNLSGRFDAFGGGLAVNGGTVNLQAGFIDVAPLRTGLAVNNLNTGTGTTVTLNVQTSVQFRSLSGTVTTPSSGTNTATVNLSGSSTELGLSNGAGPAGGVYAGIVTGDGRVSVAFLGQSSDTQTFSGNNTYTGTTSLTGGTLRIDGTTSGQGNYTVATTSPSTATLTGSGTIGLATDGTISIGGVAPTRLSAGGSSAAGTLHVVTSGSGGVIFGSQSVFLADIGSAGASDLLAIAGGYIDLTGGTDTLSLNSLGGAFDGSVYTIATFAQNLASGTFNTVIGLPSNYTVAYTPTSIMLLPIPEPATSILGTAGLAILIGLRIRKKDSAS